MILTVQECVDMSELSNEAIRAIAEHEHIPEVVAAELGQDLLKAPAGVAEIHRILEENLERAVKAGGPDKINDCKRVLERFIASQPDADESALRRRVPRRFPPPTD
jgi:hypothetical protein